jgi:hypothetical protein
MHPIQDHSRKAQLTPANVPLQPELPIKLPSITASVPIPVNPAQTVTPDQKLERHPKNVPQYFLFAFPVFDFDYEELFVEGAESEEEVAGV